MNLPIDLSKFNNILLVGIGGGYDVFGGVPIFTQHPEKQWILANYNIKLAKMELNSSLPEAKLNELYGYPVYGLPRVGCGIMKKCFEEIVKTHNVDCIILIDGGVDSLMTGDEYDAGTIIEDFVTMTAASVIPVKKFLVCVGFGTETEEGLCHYHVLQNIAELAKANAFLGSCSLVKRDICYKDYKYACEVAWKDQRKSHIQTKVISAVEGEFGNKNLYNNVDAQTISVEKSSFITPLMGIYWFFKLDEVIKRNKLVSVLSRSNTHTDALILFKQEINYIRKRKSEPLLI